MGSSVMLFSYLLRGITLGFSAGVSPGPLQAYFFSQTLEHGWRRTLPAACAPLISDGPIIALALFILAQTPEWLRQSLQIMGGAFILYLAWGAFQAYRTPPQDWAPAPQAGQKSLLEATAMNLLNPNPYIFWSAILGPIFLQGWQVTPWVGLSFVLGFYAAMISVFAGFILIFGKARQLGPRVTRLFSGISALALLSFGLYQIWEGVFV